MTSPTAPSDLTPQLVRAARALLAWSQQDLAKAAGVATSTLADFERGKRTPQATNAQAIREALESAGIRFLPTGAVIGPIAPSLTATGQTSLPVRWVSAQDLTEWANRNDGVFSLPTLLSHLIHATHGSPIQLRFPADEGVRYSGWDGQTSTARSSVYVPEGQAGWEVSSQREGIQSKADDDYTKRTAAPEPLDRANSAFIFVTTRHWPQKDIWTQRRQAEGSWREVRAYDADDLVHWIEQAPAVGLWLATRLGKRPDGVRELDNLWEEWSRATQWPLSAELVLSDRDEDAAVVLRWLRGTSSVLSLQSTTAEEVAAFFHATLGTLPTDLAASYRTRCLIATTAASARALVNAPAPLILVLTEPDPGLAHTLAEHGHYVLQAYDDRYNTPGDLRVLARPSREGIADALMASGLPEPRAQAFARDSARNLTVLRRLIPSAQGRSPGWAENPPRALLAALLAGGWDETAPADQARLAELADVPYETLIAALTEYVGDLDSPLQKVGSTWRIASPRDAWPLVARYLTKTDITRFEAAAQAVLGSADPRFEMDPGERWMAAVRGVRPEYSGMLRHGIGQVLILLALWGDQIRTVPDAKNRADAIVTKLLNKADAQRWWSLSHDFRLLVEASPRAFLDAIDDSLDQDLPPLRTLFQADDGMFGAEYLSSLLWALESLAWSPEWLSRVSLILARLDAIDTMPRKYGNRPASSLHKIHILWQPQTYATLEERLRALDLIRRRENNAAWKLMLGILPNYHDTLVPSPIPRWRDLSVDQVEPVTHGLMASGAENITRRLLEDVGTSATRWSALVDRLNRLAPNSDAALATLEAAEPAITAKEERSMLWAHLRKVLHHQRKVPDAKWVMSTFILDRLEVIYERLAPTDAPDRMAWLFEPNVALPRPSSAGWDMAQRDVDAARLDAVRALWAGGGTSAVLALARQVEATGFLGKAIYDCGLEHAELETLLEQTLRSDNERERGVAHGLIVSAFNDGQEPWASALLTKAKTQDWGDTVLLAILRALPARRWTWQQVALAGTDIETNYWQRTPVYWMNRCSEDIAFAIRKLIFAGRARHAWSLTAPHEVVNLPSELLVDVLREAAHQPFESDGDSNESTMFQYYVSEVLKLLDKRSDISKNTLIELEWAYLPLLEYSDRPAKVLPKEISEQPPLFVQLLCAVFKPSEDSGIHEAEPENISHAQALATQSYNLLSHLSHLPGTGDDGSIDGTVLKTWTQETRTLAQKVGRSEIADSQIGNLLSASPLGTDGHWPAEAVREVLDLYRSESMLNGFEIGKMNRRGVTSRIPSTGGQLERGEAAEYRRWAQAIETEYRYTAKALYHLAESYEDQARRHDEDAERRDWQ